MLKPKQMYDLAEILLIVGGLNWGLSLFDMNLVEMLLGSWPMVMNVVYGAVGASAIYLAYLKWMK